MVLRGNVGISFTNDGNQEVQQDNEREKCLQEPNQPNQNDLALFIVLNHSIVAVLRQIRVLWNPNLPNRKPIRLKHKQSHLRRNSWTLHISNVSIYIDLQSHERQSEENSNDNKSCKEGKELLKRHNHHMDQVPVRLYDS